MKINIWIEDMFLEHLNLFLKENIKLPTNFEYYQREPVLHQLSTNNGNNMIQVVISFDEYIRLKDCQMKPKHKIQKLLDQKRKVEKEIEKIQKECGHKPRHIRFVYLNQHSQQTSTRWVCDDCQKILHIPSDFELKKFIDK